jgi:ATP-binding cassette subfamily B protein
MHPPIPKRPEEEATWRTRLASLRNIRPMLGMVWDTSPALVSATAILRLFRALLPVAMLWVSKLILDSVVGWIRRGNGDSRRIWKLVALELGLAVLSDLLGRANSLFDSLLGDRFTNRISVRLIEHATKLDLASFEDPVFYDKLERARRQTSGRLSLLAAVLNVAQDGLSLISLSAALIVFSPWLMVLLVAAVIPAFLGETHFTTMAYSVLYRWTPQRRLLDYIRLLGASSQSAKEVKIFGLGPHLAERYHEVSERIFEENKKVAVKRASVGFLLNLVSTGGYYGAYAVVLLRTLAGAFSVGNIHLPHRLFLALAHVHRENPAELHGHLRASPVPEGSVRIFRNEAKHTKLSGCAAGSAADSHRLRVPQRRLRLSGLVPHGD